jgi:hypothetical protein
MPSSDRGHSYKCAAFHNARMRDNKKTKAREAAAAATKVRVCAALRRKALRSHTFAPQIAAQVAEFAKYGVTYAPQV